MDTPSSQGRANRPVLPAASDPLDLSVVIPAWNEAGSLTETIDRIGAALRANEARGFEWEIVVCDNASTDDTSEIASRAGARVAFEAVRGIARARNGGARAARGVEVSDVEDMSGILYASFGDPNGNSRTLREIPTSTGAGT